MGMLDSIEQLLRRKFSGHVVASIALTARRMASMREKPLKATVLSSSLPASARGASGIEGLEAALQSNVNRSDDAPSARMARVEGTSSTVGMCFSSAEGTSRGRSDGAASEKVDEDSNSRVRVIREARIFTPHRGVSREIGHDTKQSHRVSMASWY